MVISLSSMYADACSIPSDNNEHCSTLHALVAECPFVTEFGVMFGRSTVSFLSAIPKKLTSYDIEKQDVVNQIERLAEDEGVCFEFILADSTAVTIEETDLLYIDSDHTCEHLKSELFMHGNKARKYIVLHDTTAVPDMWPAVDAFLELGTFYIKRKFENNHGLTILQRISN